MNLESTLLIAAVGITLLAGCGGGQPGDTAEEPRVGTPKSTSVAGSQAAPAVDVCSAHGAPVSACFICDPGLREKGRLWCKEHVRYEDRCWQCHPGLQDTDRLYCKEHGLYEDECFICHPDLSKTSDETGSKNTGSAEPALFCNEHGVPEVECGICQPALADALRPGQGLKIRLPSIQAAVTAGLAAAPLGRSDAPELITVPGELQFNQNRLARITPQVEGVVRSVRVDVGDEVTVGDVLIEITSSSIAATKAELLHARAEEEVAREQAHREEALHEKGVSSQHELNEARARHAKAMTARRAAAQRLLDLGFTENEVIEVERTGAAGSRLLLRASFSGTITERQVVVGDVVAMGDRLLSLCDLGTLWLELGVPESAALRLTEGTPVVLRPPALEREFRGEITWISAELDPRTRLGRVRASLPNHERLLKAGMYVEADVLLGELGAVAVDRDAVHRFGGNPFVFLEIEPDLYEVRRIELGGNLNDKLLVSVGLNAEDRVVVAKSYLVKSEFQKSRLGAGCVH